MCQRIAFYFFILIGLAVHAQTINVRGKVSNSAGKPIADAIVTLVKQGLKDTTGTDGAYLITKSTAVVLPLLVPQNESIFLDRGFLKMSLPDPSPVKVEIFDLQGNLMKKELLPNASRGFYRFNIEENSRTAKLLIVRTSINRDAFTFRYLPLHSNKYMVNQSNGSSIPVGGKLAKIAAINDTLKITAPHYTAKAMAITTYDQQLDITLDTAGVGGVGHSPGCGKTPTLTSGSRTIQSGGQTRSYMIRIPSNYDNNHPYPLVFAFHWVGGTMNDVDGGGSSGYTWSYYGLREQADNSTNSKMIFVAPQGISNGWGNSNGQDITFVDDMIKLIEGDLCVDTTRLFAMGFSYGGGMSYAIACARAKVFRAVAVYSGAQLSGCSGGKDPIAYIGFHSISDGTCNIAGGRALRDNFVQNNGCTPQNPPEPASNSLTHICTSYQGCNPGYPVEWCAFNGGGHTPAPVDGSTAASGGGDRTWTKAEAWKFFTQF